MQRARRADALGEILQRQCVTQAREQARQRDVDRPLQSRRGLARGRGKRHAQALRRRIDGIQQCQQPRCGGGLAGARAAGDDRQPTPQSQGASHLLPVRSGRVLWRKEEVQPASGSEFVHRVRHRGAPQHLRRHALLEAPVAAQVEPLATQHEGGFTPRGGVGAGRSVHLDQGAGVQRGEPVRKARGQGRHQHLPRVVGVCRPVQQGAGIVQQFVKGQTAVSAPFHVRHHRRSQHDGRRRGGAKLEREAGEGGVQATQPAGLAPGQQRGQHLVPGHGTATGAPCSRVSSAASSASGGGTW